MGAFTCPKSYDRLHQSLLFIKTPEMLGDECEAFETNLPYMPTWRPLVARPCGLTPASRLNPSPRLPRDKVYSEGNTKEPPVCLRESGRLVFPRASGRVLVVSFSPSYYVVLLHVKLKYWHRNGLPTGVPCTK